MSNFNWCHGPKCHKKPLQSRVRGSKGNKVLRTMKVKYRQPQDNYWFQYWWNYFCNQTCLMEFVDKNIQGMIALAPRREPLETPIEVQKVKHEGHDYRWGRTPDWTETKIVVDNERNVG